MIANRWSAAARRGRSRERALGIREAKIGVREAASAEIERTRAERDSMVTQMRAANEGLVLATLRADVAVAAAEASERSARESEAQFRTLANTVPMLAWFANPDGEIGWYNQRWYDYTGERLEARTGASWAQVLDPDDLARTTARWRAALDSGEPWEDIFRIRRHDGVFRWFLSRALPLRDGAGHVVRWFGTNVDIDDQKRAEQRALDNDHAKDAFLAMLGHELRNPLAPIKTALELIAMRDPTAFARERTIIERQVDHLARLVDDLLDISRITSGKVELQRKYVELARLVVNAVELVSPLIALKSHTLEIAVPADGLAIDADPVRMVQVISNLLANAAKYTLTGGSIAIVGDRVPEGVRLRVRDTGIGISADMLPRVFEMFAQAQQASDRAQGGLGLGLAIVKSLVTMHGGSVTAASDGLGCGTELTIVVPAATELRRPGGRVTGPQPHVTSVPRKILIVDDSQDIVELLADVLRMLGHEVRVAYDGLAALAIVGDFQPDVALLDIGLPLMDGYELAGRLRAALPGHPLKLIAITGYGQAKDSARATEATFDLHLVKPVEIAQLEACIQRL